MNHRILLLDDSPMLRRIGRGILQREFGDYKIHTDNRISSGLCYAKNNHPSLILLDHALPGIGTEEVCKQLERRSITASIPVILMHSNRIDFPELQKRHPNILASLHKPLVPESLVRTVSRILKPGSQPIAALSETESSPFMRPDIPYCGDTHLIPFPTLFRHIEAKQLTGILHVFAGNDPVEVYFLHGDVLLASTRDFVEYCRGSKATIPAIEKTVLNESRRSQRTSGAPFFFTLRNRNCLSNTDSINLVRDHGQRLFSRLWKENYKRTLLFEFEKTPVLPTFASTFPVVPESAAGWLLKTLRYLTPEDLQNLPPVSKHDIPIPTPRSIAEPLRWNTHELAFMNQVDSIKSIQQIAETMQWSLEKTILIFHRLHTIGILEYFASRTISA